MITQNFQIIRKIIWVLIKTPIDDPEETQMKLFTSALNQPQRKLGIHSSPMTSGRNIESSL